MIVVRRARRDDRLLELADYEWDPLTGEADCAYQSDRGLLVRTVRVQRRWWTPPDDRRPS